MNIQQTKLVYLENFTLLQDTAKVLDVIQANGHCIVVLDQTIFYPQGGGQPYDQGTIENKMGKFIVEEVRFIDGLLKHIGDFSHGNFNIGDKVDCNVNPERRTLNSRLHSAGHVVDLAVTTLKLNWIPGKGYHFPNGPYVEYTGSLKGLDKDQLKRDIEILCNKFIQEATPTKIIFMNKDEMQKICHQVPNQLPVGKPSRVVMYGDYGVPCGGTHVSNLQDIKHMTIRKIKQEGPNIRVGYDIIR